MLFSLLRVQVQEKLFTAYKLVGTRPYAGENVFITGNRLRRDGSCIIDYYKGHHPFGLGGNCIAIGRFGQLFPTFDWYLDRKVKFICD